MATESPKTATIEPTEPARPPWVAPRPRLPLSLSLRQIMILLVYFAVASLVGRYANDTYSPVSRALLGVWIGLGIGYLGIWLAVRLGGLAIVGWVLFIVGYIIVTASMMGYLSIPSIPILIGVIIYLHIQNRRNQQNGLLWVLAVAANRQIPLGPGVEAFSIQSRGLFQERTHALAMLLRRGQSLSEAIGWVPRVVPWDAPLLIRVGEQTGRLAEALREAAETPSRRQQTLRDVFGRITYIVAVVSVGESIVTFVVYFIIPKFEAIFKDFGVDLPVATIWLVRGSSLFINYILLVYLGQIGLVLYVAFTLARQGVQGLPIVGRLFRLRHKSLILRSLALVVEANQPLDRAFDLMVKHYPSKRIRKKIQKAAEATRTGASWTDALQFVRLISENDVGVLDAAGRAGNLPWALRTLAEAGERRFAYRLQIGSHLMFMAAMLVMGVLTLFIVIVLFSPLISLIERLSG